MKLEIVYLDPHDLTPYENNTRKHSPEDIDQIKASIEADGFNDPIGIWGEKNLIVEGHGRQIAALEMGLDKVPCIRLDHLTETQRRDYAIRHNRTAELSGWDFGKLEEEIAALEIEGVDLSGLKFDLDALNGGGIAESNIVEDEPPEPSQTPIAKLGDIWQLGEHRLMCGDSTDVESVLKLMETEKAQMVFTDPPWNVNYGAEEEGNPMGYKPRTILNDFMGTEDFKNFMISAFKCMNRVSAPGCMTYVVMSAQEWGNMMLALAQNDYHWSSTIIWNKDQLVLSRKDYHTKYEPIWYGWKNGEARLHPLDDRKQCDVWDFDRPKVSLEHPTMKPVGLVARAIENSSDPGNVVLDLFGGSGTTLIASEQTGRKCYMMELDPHYCDVIIQRWENITGEKAVLLNDAT